VHGPDTGPDERRASLPTVAVEGRPLATNIERLAQALQKQENLPRGDGEEVLLPSRHADDVLWPRARVPLVEAPVMIPNEMASDRKVTS
jgi:hypothetical protein